MNPWNDSNSPPVGWFDSGLTYGTIASHIVVVTAGSAAILIEGASLALAYAGFESTTFAAWGLRSIGGNLHFVYSVGARGANATGIGGGLTVTALTTDELITLGLVRSTWVFRGSVLFPDAALKSGIATKSCFTAAVSAYFRGNFHFWN